MESYTYSYGEKEEDRNLGNRKLMIGLVMGLIMGLILGFTISHFVGNGAVESVDTGFSSPIMGIIISNFIFILLIAKLVGAKMRGNTITNRPESQSIAIRGVILGLALLLALGLVFYLFV